MRFTSLINLRRGIDSSVHKQADIIITMVGGATTMFQTATKIEGPWTRRTVSGLAANAEPTGLAISPDGHMICTIPGPVGYLLSSYDNGFTWTTIASSTPAFDVIWVDALKIFVVVGTNYCITSQNGVFWTVRTIPAGTYRRVGWSPVLNLLVAVGAGGVIATSPDGINWTARSGGAGAVTYTGVCWAGGVHNCFYVSSRDGGSPLLKSTNGTSWTTVTTGATANGIGYIPVNDSVYTAPHLQAMGKVSTNGTTWNDTFAAHTYSIGWFPDIKSVVLNYVANSLMKYAPNAGAFIDAATQGEQYCTVVARKVTSKPLASLFVGGNPSGFIYDPSNTATLFQDSAGTIPVTASGQKVGRMLDLSGREQHMVQSVEAEKPTFIIDGARKFLRFPSAGAHMRTIGVTPVGLQTATTYIVFQKVGTEISSALLSINNATDGTDWQTNDSVSYDTGEAPSTGPRLGGSVGFAYNLLGTADVAAAPAVYEFNKATNSTIRRNEVQVATLNGAGTFVANSNGKVTLGKRVVSGAVTAASKFEGDFYGALSINRTLTADEKTYVNQYWQVRII